jgi:adenine-specific DNA-methyltransferase
MNGASLDILADNLDKLKALFPQVFTEGQLDLEKFKATFTDQIHFGGERYVLNWAGKADAFRALQVPATSTLLPQPEESVNFEEAENVFIEGENLEVLKLLQKAYYGKIKCIIIDPPYNTGNDSFIYPDSFKERRADYEKRVGDRDEEGQWLKEGLFRKNSKDSGHFHSNWLSMMYPRLCLARNLLTEDGVIFVHIDDNEVHNLRLLLNEVFGEECFVAVFPWRKRTAKSDVPFGVSQDYEWILAFTKERYNAGSDIERKYYETPDFPNDRWRLSDLTTQRSAVERENSAFDMVDPKNGKSYPYNPKRVWGVTKDTFPVYYSKGKIVFPGDYDFLDTSIPSFRVFESEDKAKALKKYGSEDPKKPVSTFLPKSVGLSEDGNKEIVELFGQKLFSYPKPPSLTEFFLNTFDDKECLILDFFAGSSTTAQAIYNLNAKDNGNRRYILVQLPEKCEESSEAFKAGFSNIAQLSRERIRRSLRKIGSTIKITQGFKSFRISDSNFKIWRGKEINAGNLEQQLALFTHPLAEEATTQGVLYELLLKAGMPLTAKITKHTEGGTWFIIDGSELVIGLDTATEAMIAAILALHPARVLMLDYCFVNNDQLKTNTVLQMRDAGVEFKTI